MNRAHWDEIIGKRNRKLEASDWTQMPDSPLSGEQKTAWSVYRQDLREIPNRLRDSAGYISDEESCPIDGTLLDWQFPVKPE